jgi:hypothetical protein
MRLSFPTLQELPSVHAALVWLLAGRDKIDGDMIAVAHASGLILSEDSAHWKVDGDIVTRFAEASLSRLPCDPNHFGQILHGIGEMAARSHAPALSTVFVNALKERRAEIPLERLFDAAVMSDSALPRSTQISELALGQWISRSTLEWSTFDGAVFRIGHPDRVLGRFGLSFAARIILCAEPGVIDGWIAAHPNHPAISVVGSAALTMVFPFDDVAAVSPLLESQTIAIKCLGAASIVCPVGPQTPLSFRECRKELVAAGFTPADATWMTGMRIKNAVHARYRIEHGREQSAARLRYLEQKPDKTIGGFRNAEAEMKMLRAQIDRAEDAYAKLLPELEQMLSDMAVDWPSDGLSDAQMQSLEFIFVDTAEIRHRLASKLSHQANRDWLFKRNIARLRDFIGLKKKPEDVPKEYFLPNEQHYAAIENWAAQSVTVLYEADNRGVGRRTSDLVSGVARAAERLIAQPFFPGRQPKAWQSIMTRAVCAGRFAFKVVAAMPEDRREPVAQLNELALEHAFKLLSARNLPVQSATSFHELTAQAIQHMEWTTKPDDFREKWALAEDLPGFARALALWSSPPLTEKLQDLACRLFERVCALPLSRGSYNLQMSRMLTLLDMAVASSAQASKSELIVRARRLWASGYRDWRPISTRWEGIAEKLALAIGTDGAERAEIIADEAFANSLCRRLINHNLS